MLLTARLSLTTTVKVSVFEVFEVVRLILLLLLVNEVIFGPDVSVLLIVIDSVAVVEFPALSVAVKVYTWIVLPNENWSCSNNFEKVYVLPDEETKEVLGRLTELTERLSVTVAVKVTSCDCVLEVFKVTLVSLAEKELTTGLSVSVLLIETWMLLLTLLPALSVTVSVLVSVELPNEYWE